MTAARGDKSADELRHEVLRAMAGPTLEGDFYPAGVVQMLDAYKETLRASWEFGARLEFEDRLRTAFSVALETLPQ